MVITAGITLVDQIIAVHDLPPHGGKRSGRCLAALPGGGAANAAAVAASLGSPTQLLTVLGKDQYGKQLEEAYSQLGVDVCARKTDLTPVSLVLVDAERERTLLTLSKGIQLSADDFPDFQTGTDDLFFIYVNSWQDRVELAARCKGKLVLPGKHLIEELENGGHWPIVVASRDEVSRPSNEELEKIDCELFIMTAGGEGGEWWSQGKWNSFHTPYVAPEKIIDTCGAGDAFLGGLLAGLDSGMKIPDAINQGTQQGALCIQRRGAWPHGPWLDEHTLKPILPH